MIESVFAQVKRDFKARRLNALVNHDYCNTLKDMWKSFKVVSKELVVNCAQRCYALMQLPRQ